MTRESKKAALIRLQTAILDELVNEIRNTGRDYNLAQTELDRVFGERDASIIQTKRIIACRTNGTAKYSQAISSFTCCCSRRKGRLDRSWKLTSWCLWDLRQSSWSWLETTSNCDPIVCRNSVWSEATVLISTDRSLSDSSWKTFHTSLLLSNIGWDPRFLRWFAQAINALISNIIHPFMAGNRVESRDILQTEWFQSPDDFKMRSIPGTKGICFRQTCRN